MHPAETVLPGLTQEESFIFRWQYRLLGDFGTEFTKCAMKADNENLDRLSKGFPIEISALRRYWREGGWWEAVEHKAHDLGFLPIPVGLEKVE